MGENSKMNEIKVSIIMPSYKRLDQMVRRALQSLLDQTYQNIEVVLVDDNAKPEHAEYRESNRKLVADLNSDKIVFIENERNLGGALSRNAGIEVATGEYVTFLDDDDRYLPEKVQRQLSYISENDLDMCFTDLAIYNEHDEIIDYRCYEQLNLNNSSELFKYHLTKQITGTPTFMVKRDLLNKINGFEDVCMGQEYYLMSKIIQSGAKIGYMPLSDVVAYRYDIEAISTGPNKIKGEVNLFNYKKQYFNLLLRKQRRYVKCRHYAVMAVAYKRNKKYFTSLFYLITAVCTAPIVALKEAIGLKKRVKKHV